MEDLRCERVAKRYWRRRTLPEGSRYPRMLGARTGWEEFWAVRDVTFGVARGEALGVIGHNGAGKSTLLKLLSRITAPTVGEITIRGRLSALIEVGSGFHPELTGRENIYLNGAILGMRRREIAAKLDDIVDFAGIRPFIDTPVKWYSSGMYVRLGFSIAAHLDPDILLLDEVLAVGDAEFQGRCMQRIGELKRAGTTMIFISHDTGAVERLCDRVLLMERSHVVAEGRPADVVSEYLGRVAKGSSAPMTTADGERAADGRRARITALVVDTDDRPTAQTGEPLTVVVEYAASEVVEDAVFELRWYSRAGELECVWTTAGDDLMRIEPGTGSIEFTCEALGLQPGLYSVDAGVRDRASTFTPYLDWHSSTTLVLVTEGKASRGRFYMPHRWEFRAAAKQPGERRRRAALRVAK